MRSSAPARWTQVGHWPGWVVTAAALTLAIGIVAVGAGVFVFRIILAAKAAKATTRAYWVVFNIFGWLTVGLVGAGLSVAVSAGQRQTVRHTGGLRQS